MTVSGPEKLLYLTLGIIFLALGVVGLLIPILPGVLFLAGAVYMLGRGSRRVKAMTDANPTLSRLHLRMEQFDSALLIDKVRVAMLVGVKGVVIGMRNILGGLRRLVA